MSCEYLSEACGDGECYCGVVNLITDTGLRTLAKERGLTVLTGEQVERVLSGLRLGSDCAWPHVREAIYAAIRELEGGK